MDRKRRTSYFWKIFLSYSVMIMVPVIIISILYYLHLASQKQQEYEKNAKTDLDFLYTQTRMVVDNINHLAMQLAMIPDLNAKLVNPFKYDIYDFNLLKENLRDQISTNKLFYSIYVYFKLNDKVLTTNEGFYSPSNFYDREWLQSIQKQGSEPNDYEIRRIQSSMDPEVEVISFSRPLPITNKEALGNLIINVKKDVFFDALFRLTNSTLEDVYIINGVTGRIVYGRNEANDLFKETRFEGSSGSGLITSGQTQYITSYERSRFNSWIFVKAVPYVTYERDMETVKSTIVNVSVGVILLGWILSYLIALKMYRPWKKMIRENEEIKLTMEQNKPIVRNRLIYDILNNHVMEFKQIPAALYQSNVHFPYLNFAVLLAVPHFVEHKVTDSSLRLLAFSTIETALMKKLPIAGTLLDHGQFGFILNLEQAGLNDSTQAQLINYLRETNEMLQLECQVSLQFSVGRCYESLDSVHQSYAEAKRVMSCKALFNKTDVVFVQEMEGDNRLEYPLAVQKELAHYIMGTDRQKADSCVSEFFTNYVYNGSYPRERLLEMIVMLISSVKNELYQEGYDTAISSNLLDLNGCANNVELEQFIYQYIHALIERLKQQQEGMNYSLYIAKAIEFIEVHYASNISIGDIAGYVGISGNYLSRVFKLETGKPPLEYLSRYRITRGIELLKGESRYSLQEVSQQVGYHDAHSFIRFFKKYEGITPGEYRKKLLEKKTSRV
ncbi:AraC family transcriptional regulator [Paenibacillus radicis (ex Xue et al. 2023)]|uniref:AraC family transcriptional regulator n=1 Tax=Paenibacillus radicis (ex Xue et al. 2023) TaxID=2972489 RepID=A0ABT1YUI4_9BACL|nr:AraC family transcriptional regulator [Paenibacillus radicis (ex Xue et al. 2023)]MCR8636208.1 AraC family transcriptional regulator [Paenibacillus radicis (ex Xue et al. 2023)]